jgi:hypothetical protein
MARSPRQRPSQHKCNNYGIIDIYSRITELLATARNIGVAGNSASSLALQYGVAQLRNSYSATARSPRRRLAVQQAKGRPWHLSVSPVNVLRRISIRLASIGLDRRFTLQATEGENTPTWAGLYASSASSPEAEVTTWQVYKYNLQLRSASSGKKMLSPI